MRTARAQIDETYTYNAGGVLTEVDDDGDSTYQIDPTAGQGLNAGDLHDADEGVATVEDDLGNTTTYAMDTDGRLLKETSPDGTPADLAARCARPGRHRHRQPRQRPRTYTYDYAKDGDGDLTSVENPDGTIDSFEYDPTFHEVTEEQTPGPDGSEEVTTNTYDADGNLLTTTDALGNATSYAWSDGLLMSETDPDGDKTNYQYNGDDQLVNETDPDGGITTYAYNAAGDLVSTTDPDDHTTSYVYNDDDELTSETDPDGGTTSTIYDALGDVVSETDPDGDDTTDVYDDQGPPGQLHRPRGRHHAPTRTTPTATDQRGRSRRRHHHLRVQRRRRAGERDRPRRRLDQPPPTTPTAMS